MRDTIKGFIFGAALMLITPAFALPGTPPVAEVPKATAPTYDNFRLTYEDAEEALGQALAERGAGSKISASITTRTDPYLFSYGQPISVEIRGLRFEQGTHRFTANLVSISGKDVVSAKPIAGRYDEMVEVPVLKHSMRAGDIIKDSDIELRDYPEARTHNGTITDIASLIGKSPARVISSDRPIREQELGSAAAVKKNDAVKMVYNNGAMSISTTGLAMSDGAKGAVIMVKNLASKKLVQATVQDSSTVIIDNGEPKVSSIDAGGSYETN